MIYTIAENVLSSLDEQRYDRFLIDMIAYNITPVLPIVVRLLIKDYDLVYIDCKYASYLLVLVKIFNEIFI